MLVWCGWVVLWYYVLWCSGMLCCDGLLCCVLCVVLCCVVMLCYLLVWCVACDVTPVMHCPAPALSCHVRSWYFFCSICCVVCLCFVVMVCMLFCDVHVLLC